jgi:twitching motility protein PilT
MPRKSIDISGIFESQVRPFIFNVLDAAIAAKANDLRISSNKRPYITKNGITQPLTNPNTSKEFDPISEEDLEKQLLALVGADNWDRLLKDYQLDAALSLESSNVRFRISVFYEKNRVSVVFRIIQDVIMDFDTLGVPEQFRNLSKQRTGLVLVCGQTGSGKSSTIASFLQTINETSHCSIFTVEDPIEHVLKDDKAFICQIEVGQDVKSYSDGVKGLLRRSPDVVLIGEIREASTMKVALQLAENCLVISTLHTSSAQNTMDRILLMFESDEQTQIRGALLGELKAILCQALILDKSKQGRIAVFEECIVDKEIKETLQKSQDIGVILSARGNKMSDDILRKKDLLDEHSAKVLYGLTRLK